MVFVAIEIATGRRSKKKRFLKRVFGVATIVYSGKLRKNHKKIRQGPRKPKIGFGSRLRVAKVLAPYNACPKAVPLIKYANKDLVCKMFNYPKNNNIKKQKYFLVFWARQGLTLLLRILIQNEKSGLRSSLKLFENNLFGKFD
ncbi:hypothetical protein V8G54_012083 [Vigna mungo]|uniref:Uncharacterized protein n=1 Tax=Vigna mungo TaxID=3915 RepID=A0AAQ3NSU4_VIGMU